MKTMSSIIILLLLSAQVHAKGFRVLDELNLTSEQIEKIEKFKVEHKEKRKAMRSSHKEYREKMKELFVSGAADAELQKLHETIKSQKGVHADMKLEKMIFLKNVLNKEQRTIYIEKEKKHHKKRRRKE